MSEDVRGCCKFTANNMLNQSMSMSTTSMLTNHSSARNLSIIGGNNTGITELGFDEHPLAKAISGSTIQNSAR